MAVSNWFLYIGVFLCATGVGVVVGAIFIFYWGIKKLEEAKNGNSYTENNYSINIQDYQGGDGGSGNGTNQYPKPKNHLNAISSKTVPMNHISDTSLEEMK